MKIVILRFFFNFNGFEVSLSKWGNQLKVENCSLNGLPDLKQENNFVIQKLVEWIKDLIKKYNIDGIRIYTIMEVPKW